MINELDFSILKHNDTWKSFFIALVLFSIIGYSSLSLFNLSTSTYGISESVQTTPDFEVATMNRTGIDDIIDKDGDGIIKLSDLRGNVVVLDFMAIDCSNCHLVQEHIDQELDNWNSLNGQYPVIVISIASWYSLETFDQINKTFGHENSDKFMRWTVANGSSDAIILDEARGDILEYYNVRLPPYVLVIDHEGFAVARENTGFPLDQWKSLDSAVELANIGQAEELRFGLSKSDDSVIGVFLIGLFIGILVYFSPCAFPVLPSFITYYLNLSLREDELINNGKLSGRIPNSFEVGGFAALGQLTFFLVIGVIIFGLNGIFNISGFLHEVAVFVALILTTLGFFMLLGWNSNILSKLQKVLDKYQNSERDQVFTPRRNMYLWGIGYSAASVDCTAAAVFPFMAWLITISQEAFISGIMGLIISVTSLMITVVVLVGFGKKGMIGILRKSSLMIKNIGSWMMIFAGVGLLIYLTQAELIVTIMNYIN